MNALLDEVRPDLVSVEDDTGRNGTTTRVLRGYQAVTELACALRGIPCRIDICAKQARALALGDGGLSKEAAARLAGALYGFGGTDDEVDAAILLVATERAVDMERLAAAVKRPARKPTRKRAVA